MIGAVRRYGPPPHGLAVLHGGPGGAGECAPLARMLADLGHGVLEPLQTASSVDGQITELQGRLNTEPGPMTLLGWSWGAWLALLFAARHPDLVSRLLLVGCPPLLEADAARISAKRDTRLTPAERAERDRLWESTGQTAGPLPRRLVYLMEKSEARERDTSPPAEIWFNPHVAQRVWAEARALRASGALLSRIARLRCPVLALHGEDDPHPVAALDRDLKRVLPQARVIRLTRCGHKPWIERQARAPFLDHLSRALT